MLLAWWRCDDGNGLIINDAVGGHPFTIIDPAFLQWDNAYNPVCEFGTPKFHLKNLTQNQGGGRAEQADSLWNSMTKFSIQLRYRVNAYVDWQTLLSKYQENSNGGITEGWTFRVSGGNVVFQVGYGTVGSEKGIGTSTTPVPLDNNYHDIVATYDETTGTKRGQIYVDTVKLVDDTTTFIAPMQQNTSLPLMLSAETISDVVTRCMDGHISNIKIYDHILSQREINANAAFNTTIEAFASVANPIIAMERKMIGF